MMIETSDPWKLMSLPAQPEIVSGRRVDPDLKWGIFWAVDIERNFLLVFQHDPENRPENRLPKLRGLEIEAPLPDRDKKAFLVLRLKDKEQREIFYRLCIDIISAVRLANTEEEALERFLARTWRWHRLLRDDRDGRLSEEEQKGLIGELILLKEHLIPSIGVERAIKSWTGPFNAPKDFEIGRICVEVKARRGAATPAVEISNEYQLDIQGIDSLFLHVSEITQASGEDVGAITVTDIAHGMIVEIQKKQPSIVELFEERLVSTGFEWSDDYSDKKWLRGSDHIFEVKQNFPRIAPGMYPVGVSHIRYSISLQDCEPFRSNHEKLRSLISGEK